MQALNLIQAFAALYVLGEGLLVLNRMSSRTAHGVRLAYLILTAGALLAAASSFGSNTALECVFAVGMALYMAVDRRRRGFR